MRKIYDFCTVDGCDRPHKSRGYCQTHYMQYKRGVPVVAEIKTRQRDKPDCCTEEGCDEPVKAKGLCMMHYQRLLRHGHTKYRNRTKPAKECAVPECDNIVYSNNLCHLHYSRQRNWGKYGIDAFKFIEMSQTQGDACAICKEPETAKDPLSGKIKSLAIDHCHTTNKVRGLLCLSCNTALGLFCDDPNRLRVAAEYVESGGVVNLYQAAET